jgi:hypothetical protein
MLSRSCCIFGRGILHLELVCGYIRIVKTPSSGICRLVPYVVDLSFGIFRLRYKFGCLDCMLSFGIFRSGSFVWNLSLGSSRVRPLVCDMSFGICRLGPFVGDLSFFIFRLGVFVWNLSFAIFV